MHQSFDELQRSLRDGSISSRELCSDILKKISIENPSLNALIHWDQDYVIQQANAADLRRKNGDTHPLLGIPIVVKDNILCEGRRATAGSRILNRFIAPYDAAVIAKLKQVGAVILGAANMDEFGMGSSSENSAFGAVSHPRDHSFVPGGSSGGSAVAVSAGWVPLSLGSDTGGSVRQPASFCGVWGFKPTYGRISRRGLIAYASSLDTIGIFAESLHGLKVIQQALSFFDPLDPTSVQRGEQTAARVPATVAIVKGSLGPIYDPVLRALSKLGVQINEIDFYDIKSSVPAYYLIAAAEAASNLARYNGVLLGERANATAGQDRFELLIAKARSSGFGLEVQRRILMGTFALSAGFRDAYFQKAALVRRKISLHLDDALKENQFILLPSSPTPAFRKNSFGADPTAMYAQDLYTIPASLAGLPAMSAPFAEQDGWPMGLQIVGRRGDDEAVIDFAERIHDAL